MEIVVGGLQLESFVPQRRLQAELRLPVEFHESDFAFSIDHLKGVDAETLDHAQAARNGAVRHRPHQHVGRFRHQRRPVPERIVRASGLREGAIRFHFDRMDEIGKFDGVLNEEHWDVVANEVPVSLLCIEFHGEAAYVARRVHRSGAARYRRNAGEQRRLFARISTVAGGAGSVDTPRDVRGFAVKFYTKEGNWDLVGNNIPVFFIQDAIKFPDLIHAVKMESDRAFPQAGSAHDTFWDWASLMPESTHMLMWAMSDRAIPRSLRMIEGFGVHSFRLINEAEKSTFVKFHWRPKLGLQSTIWDETVKICGADQDFHRRD